MNLSPAPRTRKMQVNNTLNASRQLCAPFGVTFFWHKPLGLCTILRNNTPQAYPAVRCGDAQTGGLLLSGGCHAL